MRRLHKIAFTASAVEALAAAHWFALLPRLRRWGATPDELERPLPGDDLVPDAFYVTTRAIAVDAPAADVFPWVVQIGQNRGGFYTYDALENLFRLDIHSADTVHPEWQALEAGRDYVTLDPDGTMKLTVVTLDAPHAFVLRTGAPDDGPQPPGSFFRGEIAASWAFIVEPRGATDSRLVIRWRAQWLPTVPAKFAQAFVLEPVHFIMEAGMLRGIRDRAQRAARG